MKVSSKANSRAVSSTDRPSIRTISRMQVEGDGSVGNRHRFCLIRRAETSSDPGEQLGEAERFRDVVVCSGFKVATRSETASLAVRTMTGSLELPSRIRAKTP